MSLTLHPALRRVLHLPVLLAATMALTSACSSMVGGPKSSPTIYAPVLAPHLDAAWPSVRFSLALTRQSETSLLTGRRIVVSPTPGELQVYRDALWARSPADMVEDSLLRTFEESGKIAAVARHGSGISADYRLLIDVRDFKADYAGQSTPHSVVEVNVKLLHLRDQAIVASRTFRQEQPANGTDVSLVTHAFAATLNALSSDIAAWTLSTGQAHEQHHQVQATP